MIGMLSEFDDLFSSRGLVVTAPQLKQTLSESELVELVPKFDGWIIGDDPATLRVFQAGRQGRLRAAVKWGVGVDNVDFRSAQTLGIAIANTPGLFAAEV